jgi:hypothetical protein
MIKVAAQYDLMVRSAAQRAPQDEARIGCGAAFGGNV